MDSPNLVPTQPSSCVLECGTQRLLFQFLPAIGGYGLELQLFQNEQWHSISAPGNPLVCGESFNLYPQSITAIPKEQKLIVSGIKTIHFPGTPDIQYVWTGEITAQPFDGWFHFLLKVELKDDLNLQMHDGYEPEIMFNMGTLPAYERGHHVWFKTNINNPAKWNDEAFGNNFPGMYYYDCYKKYRLMMFFNMTSMNWMSRDNIARFLNYRCGFRRKYQPSASFELGLYADGFSGKIFPRGTQVFEYYLNADWEPDAPTEQSALEEMINESLSLVPENTAWAQHATDWQDFAEHCAEDLLDDRGCWSSKDGEEFILPYVNGYCPAWEEAMAEKGIQTNFVSPCMDAAVEIVWSVSEVNRVFPQQDTFRQLLHRTDAFLLRCIAQRKTQQARGKQIGTWQYVYYLEKIWRIGQGMQSRDLKEHVRHEVKEIMIPLAHQCGYLFPLMFDGNIQRKSYNGDNYGVAGIYASLMLELYLDQNDTGYLDEAKQALIALYHLPVNTLAQEVMLIAAGAQAAGRIFELTQEPRFMEIKNYLVAQTLRQMYWFDDRTDPEFGLYNLYGMFEACTPIIYPAFFENLETVGRLCTTLHLNPPSMGLLRAINLARKNNFYMFPRCLPEKYHLSHLHYIPFENLGILENARTGWVGQEIYGAGQVFLAYLLWEAYGKSSDRDVMVIHLKGYREQSNQKGVLEFLVFNPETENKNITITIPSTQGVPQGASSGTALSQLNQGLVIKGASVELSMDAQSQVYVRITTI